MHRVASCLLVESNSVRKIRPFQTTGEDSPRPTATFQRTFSAGPNCTGGLPVPIPDEFAPLNCGHHALLPPLPTFCAAPVRLDRKTVASKAIQGRCVISIPVVTRCSALRYNTREEAALGS